MTTFKCNRSGNTVSFDAEADILSMRKEAGYTEVKEEVTSECDIAELRGHEEYTEVFDEEVKETPKEVIIPVFQKIEEAIRQRGRPKSK